MPQSVHVIPLSPLLQLLPDSFEAGLGRMLGGVRRHSLDPLDAPFHQLLRYEVPRVRWHSARQRHPANIELSAEL